jgi:hypothetical protein
MDIQANKSYFTHLTDSPFACGSAPLVSCESQRNPRTAKWRSVFFIFYGTTDRVQVGSSIVTSLPV